VWVGDGDSEEPLNPGVGIGSCRSTWGHAFVLL
jgi:hypothetical protein